MTFRITLAAAAAALAMAAPAMAATSLQFGTPVGGGAPVNLGTLTFAQVGDGDDWKFSLALNNLATLFGSGNAFAGSLAVDTPDAVTNFGSGLAMASVSGGAASVTARNGGGPTGIYDFRFSLGGASNRLTSNESLTWTWTNSGVHSFSNLAIQIQGVQPGTAAWYTATTATPPVPEPGTWALMLAGAGLMALRLRGRRAD